MKLRVGGTRPKPVSAATAISLAFLDVNWERRRVDYIDNFLPMVAECIRLGKSDEIALHVVQDDMKERFGLVIPQAALRLIISKAKKRGYVTAFHRTLRRDRQKLAQLDFQRAQREAVSQHDQFVKNFREFCTLRHNVDLAEQEAEAAILLFLQENQLSLMNATVTGTVIPPVQGHSEVSVFLVADFIRDSQLNLTEDLARLETLVKGNMLANAIFLPNAGEINRKFRNVGVYFDSTPLLLALGFSGEVRAAPMLELLRLLYEFGADLRCFPETVTEMQGILQACSVALKRGVLPGTSQHFLETVQYFASAGYTSADVTRLSGDLPERLAALRIEVVDRPPFDAYQHVIDETVLAEGLARGIYYGRDAALQHDVDAVSAIMRLRRGIKPSSVEDCRALFVTNNPRLARVARAMLHRRAPAASIAPCVTDYALTNLLWLKSPTQAPDLPRKRIMADCLAAVQPSEEIWRAYLDEINRLLVLKHLTQDQYLLLRHSIGARSVLADLTRNDPDCFVEGTVPEVLRRVEAEIASEARSELADERQKRTAAEETSQAQLADERARHDRLRVRARRWASAGTKAVGTLIAILLVVGTFATASWVPDFGPPVFVKAFLLGAQILALAFGTLSLITGTTVKSLARKLEVAVELPIFEMFLRMAGESEEVLSRYA